MPAASPTELINAILDAIQQSGGSSIYLSNELRMHPRRFGVNYLGDDFTIWVYIWTLTHGGGTKRPEDEYRIQKTAAISSLNPDGYTVLLGYHPSLEVFAGFDIERQRRLTGESPSVQISLEALYDALQNGLSFYAKTNEEIAVGIRPDQFLNYVLKASSLHDQGPAVRVLLRKAAALQDVEQEAKQQPTKKRQRIVSEVSRLSRDVNFRRKVLDAYGNRCAVTRMQLKLVDAAHVLPVSAEGSNDETTNGIALSPTMHRAFDNALIYLDEKRIMRLNVKKANTLKSSNLANGLVDLQAWLDKTIHLPADGGLWPSIGFIRQANKHRRIPGY